MALLVTLGGPAAADRPLVRAWVAIEVPGMRDNMGDEVSVVEQELSKSLVKQYGGLFKFVSWEAEPSSLTF